MSQYQIALQCNSGWQQIQMLSKLNYYSRYNRIKSPKEIQTLYHLIEDLNLAAIVTDDLIERVSCLREGHYLERTQGKTKFVRNEGNEDWIVGGSVDLEIRGWGACSEGRRVASCDKNSTDRNGNIPGGPVFDKLKINTGRESSRLPSKIPSSENRTDRIHNKQKQSSHDASQSNHLSRKKTTNLQQLNFQQTQSIPDSENKEHTNNDRSSPIHELQMEAQILQSKIIKQSSSQLIETNKKQLDNIKSSNYGDEFSQGLAQLHKIDEIRNSSYDRKGHEDGDDGKGAQGDGMGCRSEKLYRLYQSDFDMDGSEEHEDQIIGEAYENIHGNNPIFIQEQNRPNAQEIPHINHQSQQQDESSQIDTEQEQRMKKQMTSIDNRIPNSQLAPPKLQDSQQPTGTRIPSKGFSEGKWPIGATQKSIQGTIQPQISLVPTTLIHNSSTQIQKQRKPFKKMMMDRKLNPRMVTSTIVNDAPVKKVNFKKLMKKESQNKIVKELTPDNKKNREFKQAGEKKQLLQAFFDQN